MKKLTLVLLTLVLFTRCNHENLLTAELTRSPFYCTKISWDTNDMLTYGSGEIIYFDKKGNLKIFSNSFLKNKDSLTWGEPGIILKEGRWIIDKDLIICIYRPLYKEPINVWDNDLGSYITPNWDGLYTATVNATNNFTTSLQVTPDIGYGRWRIVIRVYKYLGVVLQDTQYGYSGLLTSSEYRAGGVTVSQINF